MSTQDWMGIPKEFWTVWTRESTLSFNAALIF